jgi:hypothetical protein
LTAHFSGGQWWYNKHPETGKLIIAPVHPATGIKVLPDKEWFNKDFRQINLEPAAIRSFFDQLFELRQRIPSSAGRNYEEAENSICIASFGDQNSYFVVASKSKNTFFSVVALNTESSLEVYNSNSVSNSFQVIHCERIFNCQYVRESRDCLNSDFLFDCRNCQNCFGATNQRNKQFLWFNEQLAESEWRERRASVDLGKRSVVQGYLKKFDELINNSVWPENFNEQCDSCVGEYLTKATNCQYVYYSDGGAKDELYTMWSIGHSEGNAYCADPSGSQDSYLCSAVFSCHHVLFSLWTSRCQDSEYLIDCYDCENCFGCIGLRHQKFCILNTQYSEEEYWQKLDEIKCAMLESGEYGEPIAAKFSPGWFPESGSYRYFEADQSFGEKIGAHLFNPEDEGAIGEELMQAAQTTDSLDLPDSVDELDIWAGKVLYDNGYKRRFALLKQEIDLRKQLRVAPPTFHHVKRVIEMIHSSNLALFKNSKCALCKKEIVFAVNPHYPEKKIYCRECYLKYLEENN